jgi:hypothetical protein
LGNYSGNFIRVFAHSEESANFFPDKRHAITETKDPYGAVHQVPADLGAEYSGTEIPVDMAVGGGSVLGTPSRSHGGRGGRRMVYSDDQQREQLADLHAEDGQRRYLAATYVLPPMQETRSRYSDEWRHDETWGNHPNNTGAPAILRGLRTSYPQNNPSGVREGMLRRTGYEGERRLGRRRYRYTAQQLIERSTYQDRNVPAPAGADPAAAGSVFDSWQPPAVWARTKRPAVFRRPPDVDSSDLSAPAGDGSGVISGGVI